MIFTQLEQSVNMKILMKLENLPLKLIWCLKKCVVLSIYQRYKALVGVNSLKEERELVADAS